MDQKDEKDSTFVNRQSSQRIDRLSQRKDLALPCPFADSKRKTK